MSSMSWTSTHATDLGLTVGAFLSAHSGAMKFSRWDPLEAFGVRTIPVMG